MVEKTVVTVTAIRPDFIRMSEVIRCLDNEKSLKHVLVHTGQHYDELLSGIFFKDLEIRKPDYNLLAGAENRRHYQQQAYLSSRIIELFEKENIDPDIVLFLGDSNSVLASVPIKKEGYKIGHIEAGMRSYDDRMLEEINRKVCDHVSDILFVYHENYKQKAMREGISKDKIHVVGNTIVEPLRRYADLLYTGSNEHILLDIHRPENFQHEARLSYILECANRYADHFELPVKMLSFKRTESAIEKYNLDIGEIEMIPLMGYKEFLKFQQDSHFIISDSGTAQEEPSLLGIPVLVPREFTERPESVKNNCSFMLDLNKENHHDSIHWLNSHDKCNTEWLGAGTTSANIIQILKDIL